MASNTSTTSVPHDPEIADMVVGTALDGFVRYFETGGKCVRQRCKEDAPYAVLDGATVKLPCRKHSAEEQAAEQAEDRRAAAAACMTDSGLTDRQREFTFESFRERCGDEAGLAALAVVERWRKTFLDTGAAPNMILWGPIGTGKTGLSAALVRSLCEEGYQARLVNFKALLDAMKECFSRRQPTTQAFGVNRVPVLVLDDLGSERPTEWARDELLGIVDYRYERGLSTVYVSNYSPMELALRLGRDELVVGQRIVSRMKEGATGHEFTGVDRRAA